MGPPVGPQEFLIPYRVQKHATNGTWCHLLWSVLWTDSKNAHNSTLISRRFEHSPQHSSQTSHPFRDILEFRAAKTDA